MSAESSRAGEVKDTAYEYLCRLEEAKQWLEAVLQISLPPAIELESRLQNGVVLCRLGMKMLPDDPMWNKVYDVDESKFRERGLDYRYTDNINFWLLSLHKLGLPKIFYPVMTDIYHMRNMPKLVYCIHALSHLLKRLGKNHQAMEDLYGRAEFAPDVISEKSKTLRQADMPAFSIVDNLVEEELQYQALGLTDSFDEKEAPVNGDENGSVDDRGNGEGEREGGEGGREREGEGGGIRETDLFDDPKYMCVSWVEETMLKSQQHNNSTHIPDSKGSFASIKCSTHDITANLYTKRARRKKSPSDVDKALERINAALEREEEEKLIFQSLQSKDAKLPFLYPDNMKRYISELRRERKEGIPRNIMVVYSGMTRELCVEILEKMNPGAYIVRNSVSLANAFVFSFRNQTGIKHWQLSDKEGKYYWGNSSGFHTLESFVEYFAEALSQVTKLHIYPGMTTALQPQFHTTDHKSVIDRMRMMDQRLNYGQICRVIKDVNSDIRQVRKESVGRKQNENSTTNDSDNGWDSTMIVAVNRLQAEQILNKEGSPGSFLVRPSEKTLGDYALAFRTSSEVRHWKIVQDAGKFYVHPRPNPYNSLEEIITHFQEAVGLETGLTMRHHKSVWHGIVPELQTPQVTGSQSIAPHILSGGDSVEECSTTSSDILLPLPVSPNRTSRNSSTLGRTSRPTPSLSPLNPANLTSWSVDDVSQWLVETNLGPFMEIFRENLVDGECLMVLDNSLLKEDLGITALGHRSRIMKRVRELKASFEVPPAKP